MSCSARENTRPGRKDDKISEPMTRPSSWTGAAIAACIPVATNAGSASRRPSVVLGDDQPALGDRAAGDALAHAAARACRGRPCRPVARARRRRPASPGRPGRRSSSAGASSPSSSPAAPTIVSSTPCSGSRREIARWIRAIASSTRWRLRSVSSSRTFSAPARSARVRSARSPAIVRSSRSVSAEAARHAAQQRALLAGERLAGAGDDQRGRASVVAERDAERRARAARPGPRRALAAPRRPRPAAARARRSAASRPTRRPRRAHQRARTRPRRASAARSTPSRAAARLVVAARRRRRGTRRAAAAPSWRRRRSCERQDDERLLVEAGGAARARDLAPGVQAGRPSRRRRARRCARPSPSTASPRNCRRASQSKTISACARRRRRARRAPRGTRASVAAATPSRVGLHQPHHAPAGHRAGQRAVGARRRRRRQRTCASPPRRCMPSGWVSVSGRHAAARSAAEPLAVDLGGRAAVELQDAVGRRAGDEHRLADRAPAVADADADRRVGADRDADDGVRQDGAAVDQRRAAAGAGGRRPADERDAGAGDGVGAADDLAAGRRTGRR